MPKYFCEYCDIKLAHSSPGARREHNSGKRHIQNKIQYYQNLINSPQFKPPAHVAAGFVPGRGAPMHGRMPMSGPNILRPGSAGGHMNQMHINQMNQFNHMPPPHLQHHGMPPMNHQMPPPTMAPPPNMAPPLQGGSMMGSARWNQ